MSALGWGKLAPWESTKPRGAGQPGEEPWTAPREVIAQRFDEILSAIPVSDEELARAKPVTKVAPEEAGKELAQETLGGAK